MVSLVAVGEERRRSVHELLIAFLTAELDARRKLAFLHARVVGIGGRRPRRARDRGTVKLGFLAGLRPLMVVKS